MRSDACRTLAFCVDRSLAQDDIGTPLLGRRPVGTVVEPVVVEHDDGRLWTQLVVAILFLGHRIFERVFENPLR
ncbi:hypothetical protein Ae201684_008706 [Aphanomyces euteiches]|uniref:Uncharacterized protein n=1 Tax=Aphanomyces euteiches TaxID=100861 RepID=A0A6G0X3W1_9STRA|nr:hypothetical protein Ae201684_008706 [Aphanomyces euteiches]